MRKVVLIVTAAVATAAPAVALANSSSAQNSAEKQCRTERTRMGSMFTSTYGTKKNAFGKCVSHRAQQNKSDEGQAQTSAEKQCRAEQSDSTFAATHGSKTFDQFYGTNHNDKNAFGKCVSATAHAMTEATENQQVKAEDTAAQQCRTMQSTSAMTFTTKYGTKPNAFGKCVSQTAHQLEQQPTSS